jgi:hypothetical protein
VEKEMNLTEMKENFLDLNIRTLKEIDAKELEDLIIVLNDILKMKLFVEHKIRMNTYGKEIKK